MKFGDKLTELRKKNGYSQEELAEKLGVSRQSVSKWESNNTYPETDKIIQIANLFDCSMDDLINDKITDIESSLRKNKTNNIYNVWDSLLVFITKTINMFSKMRFIDGLKCVIEIILLALILTFLGRIVCSLASEIITSIFTFLNPEVKNIIREVLRSIFYLIWFIISLISIIYTFKIRYLNYFDNNKKEESDSNEQNSNIDEINNNVNDKREKIIVRDEKPFEFLGFLSKLVIIFIKFIAAWILIGTVFTTIGLIVGIILTIIHISTNILFLWITLLLIAGTVVSIQIIILIIKFIFNKKINVQLNIIFFIACIILSGFSIGMMALQISKIELIEDNSVFKLKEKQIELEYKDNLAIKSNGLGVDNLYKYVIDNNLEDNKIIVSREVDEEYFKLYTLENSMDNLPIIMVQEESKSDFKKIYKLFIKNLKNNKLVTFNGYGNDPLVIKANENTINILIENLKKLYLIEEIKEENIIKVTIKNDKVFFTNGLEGSYNGIDDTIKYNVENYSCKKEIEVTEYGDRIIYTCDYITKE